MKERTGLSDDDVCLAYRIHTVYQAVGRTAVRDSQNTQSVTFLTAGEADARFLHELFEGSTWLGKVGDLPCYWEMGKANRPRRITQHPEYARARRAYKTVLERRRRGKATNAEVEAAKARVQALKST